MPKKKLLEAIQFATDFTTIADYKGYLQQLAADNREIGSEATADDYAAMLMILNLLEAAK